MTTTEEPHNHYFTAAEPAAMLTHGRGPCWIIAAVLATADLMVVILGAAGADIKMPTGLHGLMLAGIILLVAYAVMSWQVDRAVDVGARDNALHVDRAIAAGIRYNARAEAALRASVDDLRVEMTQARQAELVRLLRQRQDGSVPAEGVDPQWLEDVAEAYRLGGLNAKQDPQ